LIPVLWLVAAKRSPGRGAAIALAAAASVAPWGVLGWPLVLRRGAVRRSLAVLALAGAVTVAAYLPLLVAGHGSAARHRWPVDRHSLVHLAFGHLQQVGWDFRLAQAGFVVALLAAAAWRLPDSPVRGPVLVTGAGLLRLVSDPLSYGYYWLPVGVGTVALLVATPDLRHRAGLAALALAYLAWVAPVLRVELAPLAGLALIAAGFGYPRQRRSSSARNRAAGSAVRGPSR
jgi:hypothetical protein